MVIHSGLSLRATMDRYHAGGEEKKRQREKAKKRQIQTGEKKFQNGHGREKIYHAREKRTQISNLCLSALAEKDTCTQTLPQNRVRSPC